MTIETLSQTSSILAGSDARQPVSKKALYIAYGVEAVAIIIGLGLAIFAGFESSDDGLLQVGIACIPFIGLAVVEAAKLPMIHMAFQVHNPIWKTLALVAVLVVTFATFADFVFGFERGFNERIRGVEIAQQRLDNLKRHGQIGAAKLPQLQARQADINARLTTLHTEIDGIRAQAQQDINDTRQANSGGTVTAERTRIENDLRDLEARHDTELARERQRCRAPGVACSFGALNATYTRQRDSLTKRSATLITEARQDAQTANQDVSSARQRRDNDIATRDKERVELEAELNAIRPQVATVQTEGLNADETIADAERKHAEAVDRSMLHRLSSLLFGDQEQRSVQRTKTVFVTALAGIVAFMGSALATLHYATIYQGPRKIKTQTRSMLRGLRGYLARRRRTMLPFRDREVVKEVTVERVRLIPIPADATESEIEAIRRAAHAEPDAEPTVLHPVAQPTQRSDDKVVILSGAEAA